MRAIRLIRPGTEAVALCSNRLASGLSELDAGEIEDLRSLMFRVLDYSELELLSYAIVPTGYHVLLRLPKPRMLSDSELLERASILYEETPNRLRALKNQLAGYPPKSAQGKRMRASLQRCIHHLSPTIANIQQRFAWHYLARYPGHDRVWADRYKCLPVEDRREVLAEAAATVDATPRWANPPHVPELYPYCSFGEAVAGCSFHRQQIARLTGSSSWSQARKAHSAAVKAAERPRRTWDMPRAVGNVSVARLAAAAQRRAVKTSRKAIAAKEPAEWLAELRDYKRKHGHCNVPVGGPDDHLLGRWLSRMRRKQLRGTLRDDLKKKMDALGVSWGKQRRGAKPGASPLQNKRWHQHYRKLLDFKKKHGHTRVPRTFGEDKTFASWIWRQRTARRLGTLEPEREQLLESVAFEWDPRPRRGTKTKSGKKGK